MKLRIRKKCFECAHLHHAHDWMTDDPYPVYWDYDWCGVNRFGLGTPESPDENDPCWHNEHPCHNCKKFKVSKAQIREEREVRKSIKRDEKYWSKVCSFFIGKSDSEISDLVTTIETLLRMKCCEIDSEQHTSPFFEKNKHLLDEYGEYCKFSLKHIYFSKF